MTFARRQIRVALVASMLTALAGCSSKPPPTPLAAHAERGPLQFDMTVSPPTVRIGDPITIRLVMKAPDGYEVELPGAAAFGDLLVDRVDTEDPRPDVESGLVWNATVTAVALQAGALEIPPLVAKYRKKDESGESAAFESELITDSITLPVVGVLTTQEAGPRDIRGPLELPSRPLTAWEWAAIVSGALAALAIAAGLTWWIMKWLNRPTPPIPPEVWALQQLNHLSVEGELAAGRDAYYRVSEIVRAYIERKFSLAASEMTTEEFLRAISVERLSAAIQRPHAPAGPVVPQALLILRRDLPTLREFLEACDLIKYAALPASEGQFQHVIGVARNFVERSAAEIARQSASQTEAAA